jgi:hypothetical protein
MALPILFRSNLHPQLNVTIELYIYIYIYIYIKIKIKTIFISKKTIQLVRVLI